MKEARPSRKLRYDKDFVGVTQKVFALLNALSQKKQSVPLEEITKSSTLPRTSVHRLLYSMTKLGYVEQNSVTNSYLLSGKFFELGNDALPYQRLTAVATPIMQRLLRTFGESVNLAVPQEGILIYILVLESSMSHRLAAYIGQLSLLHCTGVGKCIAAYLPREQRDEYLRRHGMPAMTSSTITSPLQFEQELSRVRSEGVALDKEENATGAICVAGPVFANSREPAAALSISGPSVRMARNLSAIKKAVSEAAGTISLLLGNNLASTLEANTPQSLPSASDLEYDKNFVGVTKKIFTVLSALSHDKSGVTVDEIRDFTALPRTTVHRLLYSMNKLGYVDKNPMTNCHCFAEAFFELGKRALPYQRLTAIAKPLMQRLLFTLGESVNLAVPEQDTLTYILVLESPRAHRAAAIVGQSAFLHCTSVGKCIAAYLEPTRRKEHLRRHGMPARTSSTITSLQRFEEELLRVRSEGVALDNEENAQGILCVGAPIFANSRDPIAALSISGPVERMSQNLQAIREALSEVVRTISILLGSPFPRNTATDPKIY